jgi:hypothetical protein
MTASNVDSVSAYDDDIRDMIGGGLFTRNWKIIGTVPPGEEDGSEDGTSHLAMMFVENMTPEIADSHFSYDNTISPIVLHPSIVELVELLPVSRSSLEQYYNYFKHNVIGNRDDSLVNICRPGKKSPCFDIRNCYLAVPKSTSNLDDFVVADVGGIECVPLIPSSIIHNMIESLSDVGITIVPTMHDAQAYNGCRVKMSRMYTDCMIDESSWRGSTYTSLFTRILRCKAVTTATLTVSMVLSTVYGRNSPYHNRKALTIVVHAIK